MAAVTFTIGARDSDLPPVSIGAAAEQEVDIIFPANVGGEFVLSFNLSATGAVSKYSSAGGSPVVTDANKYPIQANTPFPITVRRPAQATSSNPISSAYTIKLYFYSTGGGLLTCWVR